MEMSQGYREQQSLLFLERVYFVELYQENLHAWIILNRCYWGLGGVDVEPGQALRWADQAGRGNRTARMLWNGYMDGVNFGVIRADQERLWLQVPDPDVAANQRLFRGWQHRTARRAYYRTLEEDGSPSLAKLVAARESHLSLRRVQELAKEWSAHDHSDK